MGRRGCDLDRFFDRVQFDAPMARVARKVTDRKILRLIRRYREPVTIGGIKQATAEGTPQGSPLTPLLSNIMLDDLDRAGLETRSPGSSAMPMTCGSSCAANGPPTGFSAALLTSSSGG